VQITEGIQAGERIVASGAYGLPDNTKITSAQAQPETSPEGKNAPGRKE